MKLFLSFWLALFAATGIAHAQSGLESMKDLSGAEAAEFGDMDPEEARALLRANYKPVALEAGPIWNSDDAGKKCPPLAEKHNGTWEGGWWTTVQGKMSVCSIKVPRGATVQLEAGPILNDSDAEKKCRALAEKHEGEWTGSWGTTVKGSMSVCSITL